MKTAEKTETIMETYERDFYEYQTRSGDGKWYIQYRSDYIENGNESQVLKSFKAKMRKFHESDKTLAWILPKELLGGNSTYRIVRVTRINRVTVETL